MQHQLRYQKLHSLYKALWTEYHGSKQTSQVSGKPKKSKSGKDKQISLAGGKFTFAYELWIDSGVLNVACPVGVNTQTHHRYDNAQAQEVAIVAELYESLSLGLQTALVMPSRKESFKESVSQPPLRLI
jgi:hypothetical protein